MAGLPVFDPALCCSTGVCGHEADDDPVRLAPTEFAALLVDRERIGGFDHIVLDTAPAGRLAELSGAERAGRLLPGTGCPTGGAAGAGFRAGGDPGLADDRHGDADVSAGRGPAEPKPAKTTMHLALTSDFHSNLPALQAVLDMSGAMPAVEFVRVEYDLERTMEAIRQSELPDEYTEVLHSGGQSRAPSFPEPGV